MTTMLGFSEAGDGVPQLSSEVRVMIAASEERIGFKTVFQSELADVTVSGVCPAPDFFGGTLRRWQHAIRAWV
ncbi:MAG: hypothetical protein RL215_1034 [Planctomycetota bacterium]